MAVDIPADVESGIAEFRHIVESIPQLQNQITLAQQRGAFLTGWLAASGIDPETLQPFPPPESPEEEVDKAA